MKSAFYSISLSDIKISLKDLAAILKMLSFVMLLPLVATFTYTSKTTAYERLVEAGAFSMSISDLVALTTTVVLMKNGLEASVTVSGDLSWAARLSGRIQTINQAARMGRS